MLVPCAPLHHPSCTSTFRTTITLDLHISFCNPPVSLESSDVSKSLRHDGRLSLTLRIIIGLFISFIFTALRLPLPSFSLNICSTSALKFGFIVSVSRVRRSCMSASVWLAFLKSKKISNDQELIQSDPISCPQNQKGNN